MKTASGLRKTKSGILVFDSFNRADIATSIGRMDSGHLWLPISTWGVISGKGYAVTDSNAQKLTINLPEKNFVISFKTSGNISTSSNYRTFSLVFNFFDNNNMIRLRLYGGVVALQKIVTNTTTTLAQAAGMPSADGVEYELKAKCNQGNILAYLDGTEVINYTLSPDEYSLFSQYTQCGVRLMKNGTPTVEARFDDFKVVEI